MLKPEQVPDEAMNALLMALRLRKGGKEAIAAAINAWPEKRSDCDRRVSEKWIGVREFPVLILPLPQDAGDE